MNVVYSSSDSYAELCGISIVSLCENNRDVDTISIFVIDNDISPLNKDKLKKTAENYGRSLQFVPKINLNELINRNIYVGRWNIGTFYRLYLSSLLPNDIERVFYIDCDIIVRSSLNELFNIDLKGCSVAGVDDCRCDLYRIDIGCNPGDLYINNGFILIDLKKWREDKVEDDFSNFISLRNGDCTYMDQAPLNGILIPRHEIMELPAKYNAQRIFFDFSYDELLRLRKPEKHLSIEEYNEAVQNPIVVHFTPVFISGTRPWQEKDNHPFRDEFLNYKSLSLWKDEPLRKDDRKARKKIMTIICKMLPRKMMIGIMSYLHAVWYPKQRIKIRNKALKKSQNS